MRWVRRILAAFAVSQIAAAVSLQASIVVFLLTAAAIAAVAVGCMVRGRKSRAPARSDDLGRSMPHMRAVVCVASEVQ